MASSDALPRTDLVAVTKAFFTCFSPTAASTSGPLRRNRVSIPPPVPSLVPSAPNRPVTAPVMMPDTAPSTRACPMASASVSPRTLYISKASATVEPADCRPPVTAPAVRLVKALERVARAAAPAARAIGAAAGAAGVGDNAAPTAPTARVGIRLVAPSATSPMIGAPPAISRRAA